MEAERFARAPRTTPSGAGLHAGWLGRQVQNWHQCTSENLFQNPVLAPFPTALIINYFFGAQLPFQKSALGWAPSVRFCGYDFRPNLSLVLASLGNHTGGTSACHSKTLLLYVIECSLHSLNPDISRKFFKKWIFHLSLLSSLLGKGIGQKLFIWTFLYLIPSTSSTIKAWEIFNLTKWWEVVTNYSSF